MTDGDDRKTSVTKVDTFEFLKPKVKKKSGVRKSLIYFSTTYSNRSVYKFTVV